MNEKPRFEILERIGRGQFSNVYKARWVNAPLTPSCPPSPDAQSTIMNPLALPELNQYQQQALIAPLEHESYTNQFKVKFHSEQMENNRKSGNEKFVALKRIKFYDIQNSKMRMDCVKEVKLLQQLRHPNIINYNISFIERNELFIVLELADGGDLSKLIKYFQRRRQLLSERTILKYFTQVCSAVQYIHSKRILHRDIKPANIFMTSDGCVKLGDFGLGRFFSQNTRDAHSIVGTFYYMSPERIRESGYGFSSDIWSLGCVLYELITLDSPFSIMNHEQISNQNLLKQDNVGSWRRQVVQPGNLNQQKQEAQQKNPYNLQWLIERIIRAEYPSLASYSSISVRLRQLTTECLNPNPDARPNMDYICNVVGEAYRIQLQIQSSSLKTTISQAR